MSDSYTAKAMRITITIDDGTGTGSQMIFTEHAMQVHITKQGSPELPKASIAIFGLSESQMSHLTMLSFDALSLRRNLIEVAAGESGQSLSVVFQGEIMNAAPDMNAAPSPVMQIEAITAAYPKLMPIGPLAVSGEQTVDSLMQSFAEQAGMSYRSYGVTASLQNCVISGDPISKAEWVANTVGADLIMDDGEMSLVATGSARGEEIPLSNAQIINPQTGEIGYPSFDSMGIQVTCFFRPELRVAGLMRISSGMPRATGLWKIYAVTHDLAVNCPGGGPWRTTASGTWMEA